MLNRMRATSMAWMVSSVAGRVSHVNYVNENIRSHIRDSSTYDLILCMRMCQGETSVFDWIVGTMLRTALICERLSLSFGLILVY